MKFLGGVKPDDFVIIRYCLDIFNMGGVMSIKKKKIAIDIASYLKVKPVDIDKFIKVAIGDKIEIDGVLAEKKSFMGVSKTKVCSPIEGVVDSFDFREGQIVVEADYESGDETQAVIEKIEENKEEQEETDKKDNDKILMFERKSKKAKNEKNKKDVKDEKVELEVVWGWGDLAGEAVYIGAYRVERLNYLHRNKVVVCDELPGQDSFYKAGVLGILGFICGGSDLEKIRKLEADFKDKFNFGVIVLSDKYDLSKIEGKKVLAKEGKLLIE